MPEEALHGVVVTAAVVVAVTITVVAAVIAEAFGYNVRRYIHSCTPAIHRVAVEVQTVNIPVAARQIDIHRLPFRNRAAKDAARPPVHEGCLHVAAGHVIITGSQREAVAPEIAHGGIVAVAHRERHRTDLLPGG